MKRYKTKVIFASFFVNCIINIAFITASFYTYFVLTTLSKTQNIYSIITPTALIIIMYGFTYSLIVKRDNLILNLGRFLDYLFFRQIINIGITINARNCSKKPAKNLIKDFNNIKSFIVNKSIIGLFDCPWVLLSICIIGYISYINFSILSFFTLICFVIIVKSRKYNQNQAQTYTDNNNDFISQLFDNSKFIKCNFDYNNIVKYLANENSNNYKEILKTAKKNAFCKSLLNFFVSLTQISIFLISALAMFVKYFTFGDFILTIILVNRTLNMINNSLNSMFMFSNVRQSYKRINDAVEKTFNITTQQKPKITSNIAIELHNVSYIDYQTQTNIFDNLNGKFVGGEIYVIENNNTEKTNTLLNLISNVYIPTTGNINNFNIDNGYEFMSYFQEIPTIIESSIAHFISGFENEPDLVKIKNIIHSLNIEEIDKMKYELDTMLKHNINYSTSFIRKLNLARIIYKNTNIIILEEPFTDLDELASNYLVEYINTYKKLGKLVIISTKDINNRYIQQLKSINIVSFNSK